MNKKIIAVALILLAVVVVFAACKKDNEYKVDYTVTLENGDVVEVYEDEDGENFITNVDGDEIPLTSDEDGFYDGIKDLVTSKPANSTEKTTENKTDKNSTTTTTTKPSEENTTGDVIEVNPTPESSTNSGDSSESTSATESTSRHVDSIDWEDIAVIGG